MPSWAETVTESAVGSFVNIKKEPYRVSEPVTFNIKNVT